MPSLGGLHPWLTHGGVVHPRHGRSPMPGSPSGSGRCISARVAAPGFPVFSKTCGRKASGSTTSACARLMRSVGLAGISRRKRFKTTVRDRDARPAPDRVQRCFTAERPDPLWVADITYIPTLAGFLFLAVVMDALMPCAKASSRRSNASCWIAGASRPRPRRRWPSSSSSRVGITRIVATRPSATGHPSTMRGGYVQH